MADQKVNAVSDLPVIPQQVKWMGKVDCFHYTQPAGKENQP
jgi:hypothetical protein